MTATLEAPGAPEAPTELEQPRHPVPAALVPWRDPNPRIGWFIVVALTAFAGITRFWALGFPKQKIFDEAYYPVEAQEILRYGYEDNRGYMFIVHPPLGKWLIAFGEWLADDNKSDYLTNSFGWRIMPALFGCGTVIIVARTARRLTRSNLFGGIAGLLIACDGMSLVLARTALLDVFLEFFIAAAFGAMVIDRDKVRARLAGLIADGADLSDGVPSLGPRPWRLVAGVCFGLADAVKWTALAFFLVFIVLTVLWDRAALRAAGVSRPSRWTLRRSALPGLGSLIVAPFAAYLFCYLGWFAGENSWGRHYADTASTHTHLNLPFGISVPWDWAFVPGPIRSLGAYTLQAYRFHQGLDSGHAYASNPWSWLVLGRPVDFYYQGSPGTDCSAPCSKQVLLIGTPLLWWAFVPMLLWLAWHYLTTRDWRAGAIWVAFLAGWVFWFQNLKRTMFLFYMAPLVPFLIFGLVLAMGTILGPVRAEGTALFFGGDGLSGRPGRPRSWSDLGPWLADLTWRYPVARVGRRRAWGTAAITVFLALVLVDFAWMFPIFTGGPLSNASWHAHMWLPSWI
ncbi:phospholipid carrier-dependent glycosyltransferase [Jatrophihabitans sp.]|uniref:dolichyl-phosphate-mannose--protein mannosyltransferase n=1 Tax=Jatrophihabitans sp. TaxID=1932789 RepID=UPI0030C6EB4A|nr:phospholipid carrier-dependent glycosyltransferase [Jatrophihabitans sp.]